MVYMGSKNRLSKELKVIIESYILKQGKDCLYIEPFVGGANLIDKIEHNNKIGYDINKYLIALLNYVKYNDIEYKEMSKEEFYNDWKYPFKNGTINKEDWEIGYVGFTKSFNSLFFSGYGEKSFNKKNNKIRKNGLNYHKNLIKQSKSELFKICNFNHSNYLDLKIPDGSVIYCDPPYKNTSKYNNNNFNHEEFWNWCIKNSEKNIILISEKEAPDCFISIFEKEITHSVSKNKKIIEKLFILDKKRIK